MRQWKAAIKAAGEPRVCRFWRLAIAPVALLGSALVFGAPADSARGSAWLQAQFLPGGRLQIAGSTASDKQALCETATTLQLPASSSAQVAAILAQLKPAGGEDATETLAYWQTLRQQRGGHGLGALADGSSAMAQRAAPLAMAVILRGLKDETWPYLEQVPSNKQHRVTVAKRGYTFFAKLLASAQQYAFSADFAAQIEALYVVPQMRSSPTAMQKVGTLLRRWAGNRDVAEIWLADRFAEASGYNRRMLEKLGMKAVGGLHSKWIYRG